MADVVTSFGGAPSRRGHASHHAFGKQLIGPEARRRIETYRENQEFIHTVAGRQFDKPLPDLFRRAHDPGAGSRSRGSDVFRDSKPLRLFDRRKGSGAALTDPQPPQLAGKIQAACLALGSRAQDEGADADPRRRQPNRRTEVAPVFLHRGGAVDGIDEMGERKRATEPSGLRRAMPA